MRLEISTQAEIDLSEAAAYYASLSQDAVTRFEEAVVSAFESLSRFWMYEIKYSQIRTYRITPYPYLLHFRVDSDQDRLVIEALIHERALDRRQ